MDDVKQQVVDRLKQGNNILVTVRNNPSVDLLSACIGLALALDKLEKHAAAVFSGEVPSTIEFLKPEDTIERSPDSLRDFIIALDKSKADKLRYKVEDKVVRIFITPYKTSLSEKDLEFSQGDFNVDVVVALGAHEQQDLDQAITQHGRILHDAAVVSINNTPDGNLGSLNWQDIGASSVSEMVAQIVKALGADVLDPQIATALLTGIVAETARFSNEKTSPKTMGMAGDLMAAGANQQLVATELAAEPHIEAVATGTSLSRDASDSDGNAAAASGKPDDGTLEIEHAAEEMPEPPEVPPTPVPEVPSATPGHELLPTPEPPHISNVHGSPLGQPAFTQEYDDGEITKDRSYLIGEPAVPSTIPSDAPHTGEPSGINPFDVPPVLPAAPILGHDTQAPAAAVVPPLQPTTPAPPFSYTPPEPPAYMPPSVSVPAVPPVYNDVSSPFPAAQPTPMSSTPPPTTQNDETLEQIERSVGSPHITELASARNQVLEALQSGPQPLEPPIIALNATPLGDELHPRSGQAPSVTPDVVPNMAVEVDADGNLKPGVQSSSVPIPPHDPGADQSVDLPPPNITGQFNPNPIPPVGHQDNKSFSPPPGPPPMMPPTFPNAA